MTKSLSKFTAPIFIASTVVFFLGSALKFVLGGDKKQNEERKPLNSVPQKTDEKSYLSEELQEDETPHEPEEDPVSSL